MSSRIFIQGKTSKEIHAILTEAIVGQNWMAQFKRGDFSTCDAPCPERPKTIVDQIHELILEYRRISAKSIAEQLGVSRERVGSIIHEDLDMRKLSAKCVPKCLNADEKTSTAPYVEQVLEFFFSAIQMIFCRDW